MLIILKIKERWLSGQRHLTVNQTTFVYVGSNPTLSIHISPFRLVVRTLPFRGKGTGSIPVRDKNGKRNVAQPGSASALGAEGRVFESRRSDSFI